MNDKVKDPVPASPESGISPDTNEKLLADVERAIQEKTGDAVRNLVASIVGGKLVIGGQCDSYNMKQAVSVVAWRIVKERVRDLVNEIAVQW